MKIQILDKTKKRKFIEEISYLGIKKIPQLLIKTGKGKIRAFSGSFSNNEIINFWKLFPIEGIGLYFGRQVVDKRTGKKSSRLSLDALHVLKGQIKKNIIELDNKQANRWFRGEDIELGEEQAKKISGGEFVAVKSNEDFIGIGRLSLDKKILNNFLPKERRIKN